MGVHRSWLCRWESGKTNLSNYEIRWGKADPETQVSKNPDGTKTITFPRRSINLTFSGNSFQVMPMTYHPFENEVWLHSLNLYDEDDMIATVHSSMKLDFKIGLRVRGTNMKTLRERGEQFARFNFEILFD